MSGFVVQSESLHGDFSNKNILARDDAFVVIDPIPALGRSLSRRSELRGRPTSSAVFPTAAEVAYALNLDPLRTARWTAVHVILQTRHAWSEDQPELDALVDDAEFRDLLT